MLNWGIAFSRIYSGDDRPPAKAGGRIPIECRHCFTHTDAEIVSVFVTPRNQWHDPPADMEIYNFLLRCTRCRGALLLLWSYGTSGVTAGRRLFPVGSVRDNDPGFKESVPAAIREDLKQAEACESVGASYGAALLYRRAVQYLCRHQKCPDNGLKAQIADLASRGIITAALKELADHVRIIGNDIAHPDATHPARIEWGDIEAAREFARQLVEAVYVSPYKASELRKALKSKGVPGA